MSSETQVMDNPAKSRFELRAGGHLAVAAYEREGERIVFTHTVVPPEMQGQGVGSRLIGGALDQARAAGLRVVPVCTFVARFIDEHPAYANLVEEAR